MRSGRKSRAPCERQQAKRSAQSSRESAANAPPFEAPPFAAPVLAPRFLAKLPAVAQPAPPPTARCCCCLAARSAAAEPLALASATRALSASSDSNQPRACSARSAMRSASSGSWPTALACSMVSSCWFRFALASNVRSLRHCAHRLATSVATVGGSARLGGLDFSAAARSPISASRCLPSAATRFSLPSDCAVAISSSIASSLGVLACISCLFSSVLSSPLATSTFICACTHPAFCCSVSAELIAAHASSAAESGCPPIILASTSLSSAR
mmetsp:Transcript_15977/g.40782  ORF Transcript_15977/g.40782 Transcript_15977/m.40782 type:complete len:271 (+) Transcript_15977:205-1017(+)